MDIDAERIDYSKVFPDAMHAMAGLERAVRKSTLEPGLLQLVKLRSSQINQCGFCTDQHTKDARAMGETEQRLYLTSAWREAPIYSDRERAALAWCEAITLVSQTHAPKEVCDELTKVFTDEKIVALTLAVVAINGWNRLSVGLRTPVGATKPPRLGGRSISRKGGALRTQRCDAAAAADGLALRCSRSWRRS